MYLVTTICTCGKMDQKFRLFIEIPIIPFTYKMVGRFGCRLSIGVGIDGILFEVAGFGSLCFGGLSKSYQSGAYQEGSCGKWSRVAKPCLSQSTRIRNE
ncbi:unnamed protein product [Lactuca virosa]|uniref:Uncharacterized protein n=1 Tax=Lactuca virosa TaxID=75947 RepID=A0AAU9NB96_9ASTR|nr:unnamed protein product [Lactuca virosa]